MTTLTVDELLRENEDLRRRLEEAEQALQAIHAGEVDAVVIEAEREQVYTLEAAENPYRLLVARVPQPAVTLTADGTILSCNQRFAELVLRPAAALRGRPLCELAVPESREALEALLREGRTSEIQGHVTLMRSDGTPVAACLGVSALREGALGLCLMVTDLTEQRQYEELLRTQAALRASEEKYHTLFNSIDEGFCVIQVVFDQAGRAIDYRFLEINPSFEHHTGLRDVVGRSMRDLRPAHEEHWFRIYGQVALTGEPIRFQNRAAALDRWYDVYAFRTGQPQERKVAVLFTDITRRKLSEEALQASEARLRTILDNAPAVVYLVDAQQRFTFINRRWEPLFNLTNDQVAGRSLYEFFPRDVADQFAANNRQVLDARRPLDFEEVTPHADGNHTYFSAKVPLLDSAGAAYAVCGISIDITERKRAVEALHRADRKKDEFLATLAHELRNPLAPIRNAVKILHTKGPPDPELQWARGVIDRQVDHMARLLEDLLDVSRISRNNLQLRKEQVELTDVLEAAVETSRPAIDAGRHELAISLPSEPIPLVADSVRLAQVFSNLLTNAAKYTENGGRIRLSAAREGGEVVVSVEDNGIGIAAEALPQIFEIFSQAAPALERSQGGLGIGLSLVKGLVELHGGRIAAKSDGPGKGSQFVVSLPVASSASQPPQAARPSEDASFQRPAAQSILVVDDNRDSAESLARLLAVMGHRVATAHDGEQAVELAGAMRPDVVLLDIGMPKLNGFDACRRIRQQPWGLGMTLVALTGWGQQEDRRRTEEAGFDYHLVKPVDTTVLMKLLATVPAKRAKADESGAARS